ncbi:MAG: cell division protein FtsL [Gammaproteobacteria bacterium]|nr:cell division protein FtsL [Gammaproteobacteria bacterium]
MSALQVVLTRFQNRQSFVELQELIKQQDDLERGYDQLLLEQGTWGTHSRIEELARTKLNMMIPHPDQIRHSRS